MQFRAASGLGFMVFQLLNK